jgi:hypothetical protein
MTVYENKEFPLVFDRGIVSEDNLKTIFKQGLTHFSVLDRNGIPGLRFLEDDFPELIDDKD